MNVLEHLYRNPDTRVAVDTETNGLTVHDKRSTCIGVSIAFRDNFGEMVSAYFPTAHRVGENIDDQTFKQLRYVLSKQRRQLIFANRQFDVLSLETVGIFTDKNPFFDVLTMMQFIDEEWTRGRRGLDELAAYLSCSRKIEEWPYVKYNDRGTVIKETTLKHEKETGWRWTTPEMLDDYARTDAEVTYEVLETLEATPEWKELPEGVWDAKQDTIRTLTEMKRRGVLVNLELTAELEAEGEAAKARIKRELGLNPASPKDMQELMLVRLGLPVLKRNPPTEKMLEADPNAKGSPSFDKSVMPEYDLMLERDGRTEAKLVREYRGWQTAVGLLLKPYQKFVSPDGRLRTSYTTHVTATGRLSSTEPNLQQISKDGGSPWNDRIKKCFVAKPGYVLLSADYSQLELRLGTAYAQEPALLKIFAEGRDVFTEMTEQLIAQFVASGNTRMAESWTRQKTKTLVYSIQYGGGVRRLQSAFGISKAEATRLRSNFYRSYPRFRALSDLCAKRVKEQKSLRLWTGRKRHFRFASDSYKGMNSLIQGGAADVVDRVMVYAMKNLDNPDCRMLLQVHDALVFEVKEELADEYSAKIQALMEDVNGICGGGEELFPVKFAVEVTTW